jgi:hypothetical protein
VQTGRTKIAVYLKRRKLGIVRCSPTGNSGPRWIEEELALLGTAPDEEIAQRLDRKMTAVSRKRCQGACRARKFLSHFASSVWNG